MSSENHKFHKAKFFRGSEERSKLGWGKDHNFAEMYCSISGSVAQQPVVSKTTGYLYDRQLIEKLLQSNGGKCPHTGVDMTIDDLIGVRTLAPPPFSNGNGNQEHATENTDQENQMVIPTLTNVPSILKHLQNEWDGKAIEVHELRKALQKTRLELAAALYRVDASQRVIAKLQASAAASRVGSYDAIGMSSQNATNGGEEAGVSGQVSQVQLEQTLATQTSQSKVVQNEQLLHSDINEVPSETMPETWIASARELSTRLMTTRKARVVSGDWAQTDDVAMMSVSGQCAIDNGQDRNAVTCLKIGKNGNAFVGLENGKLSSLKIEDMSMQRRVTDAHGSNDKFGINSLCWNESQASRVLSGGTDGLIRVWDVENEWKVVDRIDTGCEVVGIERHPDESVFFIGGSDYWTWHDVEHGKVVARSGRSGVRYECSSIHPDGLMFAMGCADGIIEMWDAGSSSCVRRLGEKGGKVYGLEMSERGYYLASCRNGIVELWDLRKRDVVGKVDMGMESGAQGVALDGMGEFGCGVGNGMASLFVGRKKAKMLSRLALGGGETQVNATTRLGVAWGANAKFALVGSGGGMVYKVSSAGGTKQEAKFEAS